MARLFLQSLASSPPVSRVLVFGRETFCMLTCLSLQPQCKWGVGCIMTSSLVREQGGIVAGLLLGPGVAGWVAYEKATYMVGRAGLILLVMEGGLGVDVENFKKTWKLTTTIAVSGIARARPPARPPARTLARLPARALSHRTDVRAVTGDVVPPPALVLQLTGTVLPCAFGWLLMLAFDRGALEGFAAGTALSSTSIGMSLMMLIQYNYLKTPLGGLIAASRNPPLSNRESAPPVFSRGGSLLPSFSANTRCIDAAIVSKVAAMVSPA